MPELVPDTGEPRPVCDRCHMPAIRIDGKWQHAEAADAAFCALVMGDSNA